MEKKSIDQLVELRKQGLSLRAISRQMGIPGTTLRKKMKKALGPEEYDLLVRGPLPQPKEAEPKLEPSILASPAPAMIREEQPALHQTSNLSKLLSGAKRKLFAGNFRQGRGQLAAAKSLAMREGNLAALRLIEDLEAKF